MSTTPTSAAATAQLAATLRTLYRTAVDTAVKALATAPEQSRDITARAEGLRAEHVRRVAAGVKINVNAGSFDARHAALLQAAASLNQQQAAANGALAQAVAEVALRALVALDAAATAMHDLESRKAEREAEAARVAAAAAAVQAEKDAEARGRRELAAIHASRGY